MLRRGVIIRSMASYGMKRYIRINAGLPRRKRAVHCTLGQALAELVKNRRPDRRGGAHEAVIIAVDGPAGAGKSTVCKLLAEKLGFLYLDTGAMYRALAWAIEAGPAERDQVIQGEGEPEGCEVSSELLPAAAPSLFD